MSVVWFEVEGWPVAVNLGCASMPQMSCEGQVEVAGVVQHPCQTDRPSFLGAIRVNRIVSRRGVSHLNRDFCFEKHLSWCLP
jgi:hypothetical protein